MATHRWWGFTDLLDLIQASKPQEEWYCPAECTTVVCRESRSGGAIVAGTWDSNATAGAALVLLRRTPDAGPATLALTTAGWPVQQGVNASGLALATNNLVPRSGRVGVPYIAALAELAREQDCPKARKRLSSIPLASGHYYPLADSSGDVCAIESTATKLVDLADGPGTCIAHTNHYLAPALRAENQETRYTTNSRLRLERAERLLGNPPELNKSRLWRVFTDHAEGERRICRHGNGDGTRTCAAFVIDAASRLIQFTDGPPCRQKVQSAHL